MTTISNIFAYGTHITSWNDMPVRTSVINISSLCDPCDNQIETINIQEQLTCVDEPTTFAGSDARWTSLVRYAKQYSMSDCLRANASNGPQILRRKSSLGFRGSHCGQFRTFAGGGGG